MKKVLSPVEKKELLNISKELFQYEPSFNYSISFNGVQASYSKMTVPKTYSEEYLEELKQTFSEDTLNSYSVFQLGEYYINKGDFTLAKSYFQKSYDLLKYDTFKSDSAKYYSVRGLLKNCLNREGVFSDFEKALSINPQDSLAINFYPLLLMSRGEYTRAKNIFANALKQSSNTPVMLYTGLVLSETMASFQKIKEEVNENQTKKATYRNMNYKRLYDYSLANKYKKGSKRNPENQNARMMSDILALFLKIILFESTDNFEPIFDYPQRDLRKLATLQKEVQRASRNNQMNDYTANNNLGYINYMQGNTPRAIDYFCKAIDVFPLSKASDDFNPNESFDALLAIYHFQKDTANWRKTLERRIATEQLHEKQAKDWRDLAFYYYVSGSPAKAKEWAKKSEAKNPGDIETLKLLAHLYFLDQMYALTSIYAEKMDKAAYSSIQAYKLFLQFAIYKLYNGDATGAYENIKEARRLLDENSKGNKSCRLCDELEAKFIKIAAY